MAQDPKKETPLKSPGPGNYMWRGGKKIELEEQEDRFTIIPPDKKQIEALSALPGVRSIEPITKQVFKVITTAPERDSTMAALRSKAFNTIAHHAYRPKNSEATVFYITDKCIVRFKPDASTKAIEGLLQKYGLNLIKEYEGQPNTYLLQVSSDSGGNPVKVTNRLVEDEPIVEYAEPVAINRFQQAWIPSDPLYTNQWHLFARNGVQLEAAASVNAPEAWDITRGERSIVIALLDDGFYHPDDLVGDGKIVFPKDYIDGLDPMPGPGDYHGTPCAGVALAESNGKGLVGIAPGCAFMPVRFPLNSDDDKFIEVFNEVGRRADVISCSWGPPPAYAPLPITIYDMFTRITTSGGPRGKGCVVCFAAGNYNASVDDAINASGHAWLDYGSGMMRRTVGPILNGNATHPNIIAVSASTSLNKHADYSNYGPEISVCAPSNNFHPLDRQKSVAGRGIWTTDNEGFGDDFTPGSLYTGTFGGTSSATPLVAGIAGLVLSVNPDLAATEVKDILQSTADKIVDNLPDVVGKNRGSYNAEGHSEWFGFGKVNAAKAVTEAKRRKNH